MLNNNVAPNTVVPSRVIYHTLLELNSTPSPSCFLKGVIHSCLKASVCSQLPNCSPLVRALVPIYKAISKASSLCITSLAAALKIPAPNTTTELIPCPLPHEVLLGPHWQASPLLTQHLFLRRPCPTPQHPQRLILNVASQLSRAQDLVELYPTAYVNMAPPLRTHRPRMGF